MKGKIKLLIISIITICILGVATGLVIKLAAGKPKGRELGVSSANFRNNKWYAVNEEKPFTGTIFRYWPSGQVRTKIIVKDGKGQDLILYHKNGARDNIFGD